MSKRRSLPYRHDEDVKKVPREQSLTGTMSEIVDDKSEHCIPFILERLKLHKQEHEKRGKPVPPFFLGLNGVQGAGKTTLVGEHTFLL